MRVSRSWTAFGFGLAMLGGSVMLTRAFPLPMLSAMALGTVATLVVLALTRPYVTLQQSAAMHAALLGLVPVLASGARIALERPLGAALPFPDWKVAAGAAVLGSIGARILAAAVEDRARANLWRSLAHAGWIAAAIVVLASVIQTSRRPDADRWASSLPFADEPEAHETMVRALGCHPESSLAEKRCPEGTLRRDPSHGWLVLAGANQVIVVDGEGARRMLDVTDLGAAPPAMWLGAGVLGLLVAAVVIARARRTVAAYEALAAHGKEAKHLGKGRVELASGEIVTAPRAEGLDTGPVVLGDEQLADGSYRTGRSAGARVVEGSIGELRETAKDIALDAALTALAWSFVLATPLAVALVLL